MAALGWLLNLGFAGGTAGSDPPTAQPLRVVLSDGIRNRSLVIDRTANTLTPVKSKNSAELTS